MIHMCVFCEHNIESRHKTRVNWLWANEGRGQERKWTIENIVLIHACQRRWFGFFSSSLLSSLPTQATRPFLCGDFINGVSSSDDCVNNGERRRQTTNKNKWHRKGSTDPEHRILFQNSDDTNIPHTHNPPDRGVGRIINNNCCHYLLSLLFTYLIWYIEKCPRNSFVRLNSYFSCILFSIFICNSFALTTYSITYNETTETVELFNVRTLYMCT